MELVILDIMAERRLQDNKWGEQNHSLPRWLLILSEEIGELCKAVLEEENVADIRKELVQVAAVSMAMIESFDRHGPAGKG